MEKKIPHRRGGWSLLSSTSLTLATLLAFLVLLTQIGCKPQPPGPDPNPGPVVTDSSWVVPIDVSSNPTQADYYNFGWQSFVALNWPADLSYRGKPNRGESIGAMGKDGFPQTVVWQTWQEQFSLFLPNGVFPGEWNDQDEGCNSDGIGGYIFLSMFSKNEDGQVKEAFNEATGQPLIDIDSNYVRYEVRTCESEYDYFIQNQYYNALRQKQAIHTGSFQSMPNGMDSLSQSLQVWARFGSTEAKAAWRILPPSMPEAQQQRYFRAKAILMNSYGQCVDTAVVGLVGFHILRLTPSTGSTWYWASFEQIDNLTPQQDGQGHVISPSFNTNPPQSFGASGFNYIPDAVVPNQPLPQQAPVLVAAPPFQQVDTTLQALNQQWATALANTPFQYYMMVGAVNPTTSSEQPVQVTGTASNDSVSVQLPAIQVNTADMANSTLETYMYQFSPNMNNCVVCHAGETPQFFSQDTLKINGSVQVFTFLFGFAQYDTSGSGM